MPKITVLSKTIKTNRMPDIPGFIQAMKDMGAKVSTKEGTTVVDLRREGLASGPGDTDCDR
ncbi:unnamed protein product [marine sediment metagenome]|uniref:Enolpyruvate transferase domain-containing protein n=1 Tax=marine sediment metagenome TaxID=412755 RepID=X1SS20_9ZZZZ